MINVNKTRKKGLNSREKGEEKLVNYKDLERNLLNEISNEFNDSSKNKDNKKK